MLKRYGSVFKIIFFVIDCILLSCVWLFVFYFRFIYKIVPLYTSVPDFFLHLYFLGYILLMFFVAAKFFDLYYPIRMQSWPSIFLRCFKTATFVVLGFIFLMYFTKKDFHYSRAVLILFWFFSTLTLILSRVSAGTLLAYLRKKGFNQRHVAIVGTGDLAKKMYSNLKMYLETGINVVGFIKNEKLQENSVMTKPVLGTYKEISEIVKKYNIDQLIFALSAKEERYLRKLIGFVDSEVVTIKIALDLGDFFTLCYDVDNFNGMPILSLRENPVYGWSRVLKRLFDIVVSFCILLVLFPFMIMVAIGIKLTSRGPVFYKQERMGIDGKLFYMIKFRTMKVDAEKENGPVWAKPQDSRRTVLGAFLRRTSLDEVPQFLNVLKGEMSLVGPRPERPFFIEKFKKEVPRYMLRHKIKSGITGLAQIKGLRGNTSIEERIESDLYYIENWSLWLDLKIMFMTIPAVIKGESAY